MKSSAKKALHDSLQRLMVYDHLTTYV